MFFFYGKGNENYLLGMGCSVHDTIVLAVKRVEFVRDTMSYVDLRGHQCNIIVLNSHVSSEERSSQFKIQFL